MIKKLTDKDKEDWENFLNTKKKNLNKNSVRKKDIKNTHNDKQDWENFLNNKEKIPNKDFVYKKNIRYEKIKTVYDTWVFSKDIKSPNPNWLLIDTIT